MVVVNPVVTRLQIHTYICCLVDEVGIMIVDCATHYRKCMCIISREVRLL